jgi:O-6-methylguanine DNA methyltransferase
MLRLRTPHGPITIRLPKDPRTALKVAASARACLRGTRTEPLRQVPDGTAFQQACWRAATRIPAGETRTYSWLAAAAGSPRAFRAAAQAMRRNPWPLVIPCHRVVGAHDLGGYAGSRNPSSRRMMLKKWLLAREAAR